MIGGSYGTPHDLCLLATLRTIACGDAGERAKASTYMVYAEKEFGGRCCCPHANLPSLLDDTVPEERALALEFGLKLLGLCSQVVVYGSRISNGMKNEIAAAEQLGLPILYRSAIPGIAEARGDNNAV